jgi:hypothetical protein
MMTPNITFIGMAATQAFFRTLTDSTAAQDWMLPWANVHAERADKQRADDVGADDFTVAQVVEQIVITLIERCIHAQPIRPEW